jgi:hypothetical protein
MSWALSTKEGIIGTGNWRVFPKESLPLVFDAAEEWKKALAGIEKPWLCWCVDEDWCLVQQKLVTAAGWTPVVGTDGAYPSPRLTKQAVFIDFNRRFRFPMMWIHFPLEFAFSFARTLAFWHSDVLPPVSLMQRIGAEFDTITDGQLIGVRREKVGLLQRAKRLVKGKPLFYRRWFEVIGCTTAGASLSQFENGCGWWRYPQLHPNAQDWVQSAFPREHGVGVWYWEKYCRGQGRQLSVDITPHHYSTNNRRYIRKWTREGRIGDSKQVELQRSFSLEGIVRNLGLPS